MTTDLSFPSRPTSEDHVDERDPTRRDFLLGASTCLSVLVTGCTVPVRTFRAARAAVVAIPVDRFPELERPGGAIRVMLGDAGAVFVRREEDDSYTALSAVCTHQGCLVDVSHAGFRCPCHGSTYDRQGRNTGGPARRPLARFEARRIGGVVELLLAGHVSGEAGRDLKS
jgi:thiosulfate dehydrogenase [quinone] large subunit